MRRDRREFLGCLALSAFATLIPGTAASDGDLLESHLTDVRVLEFSLGQQRVESLSDRQRPSWSNKFESLVYDFLESEVARAPILKDVIVRDGFPAKPWIPGVLELGLKVVVDKVDAATYVAGIVSTYRRINLRNRDRLIDKITPLTSADFSWNTDTSLPTAFLINATDATDPVRLAEVIFEKFKIQLTRDLRRISQIKSAYNE
jgi:hypothetical protein